MEVSLLKKIFSSINNNLQRDEFKKQYNIDINLLKDEIHYVINNPEELKSLTLLLLPESERIPVSIFEKLQEVEAYLDFKEYSHELMGNILFEVLKSLPYDKAENILSNLESTSNFYFWSIIHALPFTLSRFKLESSFAAFWFNKIGENVKEDLASGDFFKALDNYAYNFPFESLEIFDIYFKEGFSGFKYVLGSIILGSIRATIRDKNFSASLNSIEEKLNNSINEEFRVTYYKSWITTYYRNAASIDEIFEIVQRAKNGREKEINEAFFIVYKIIVKDLNNEEGITQSLDWLYNNSSHSLPPEAKFQIINILYWLITFDTIENIDKKNVLLLSIFRKVLPIEITYPGIWRKIEELLTSLIRRKKESSFNQYFKIIISHSLNSFLELLSNNQFKSLEYYLKGTLADSVFTQLLFSNREEDIRTAIELFKQINDAKITKIEKDPSEEILSKILLEFSRNVLLSKGTSKFLLQIEPFFRKANNNLKEEFISEMVFQAINYRGNCYDEWTKIENPSDILKEVIEKSENYYAKLKKVSDLPGRNFSYYKFEEGAELERKMQSRDLNKKVKEKSVFLSLIKHTQVLYGDSWAVQDHVSDGHANKFNEFSYSVEFPRIENIDPEGMVLKRMYINSNILRK